MAYLVDIYKECDRHKHVLVASDVPPDTVDLAMKMFMAGMYRPSYLISHYPTANEFDRNTVTVDNLINSGGGGRKTIRVVHTHGHYPGCRFMLVYHNEAQSNDISDKENAK